MPFVPFAQGVQVELRHRLFGTPCETTVTLEEHAGTVGPTLASAQLAAFLWWRDQMLPLLSWELLWIGMTTRSLASASGPAVALDFATPIPGGIVVRSLPANVAVRLNYEVANPPGGYRGCMFLPGVPANQVTGNLINQGWKDAVFEAAVVFIDDVTLQGWRWVVASKFHDGAPRAAVEPMRVVTPIITAATTGQRRSRLHNEELPP